jgi:hypothetical protein
VLLAGQVARWAQRFGVADAHVRLDHLLSHMIRAVADLDEGDVVLFGGTALCRTYLTEPPWLRLSEDLDLLVVGDARAVTARFEAQLPRLLRREFPTRSWTVAPSAVRAPSPALLGADGLNVRVQLLPATAGWAAWRRVPTQQRSVDLRYDDLPDAVDLSVPTVEGFAVRDDGSATGEYLGLRQPVVQVTVRRHIEFVARDHARRACDDVDVEPAEAVKDGLQRVALAHL